MTDDNSSPLGRAFDVLVYAPLGAGIAVLEAVPAIVHACTERGKAEVARRHRQVEHQTTQFRSTGQFAWSYGVPKVRNRAGQQLGAAQRLAAQLAHTAGVPRPQDPRVVSRPSAPSRSGVAPITPEPVPTAGDNGGREPSSDTPSGSTSSGAISSEPTSSGPISSGPISPEPISPEPISSELPIPGYDALSAPQVVERLAGLNVDELRAVQAYESAHRKRRTILGKIEQLAARA
jgi:hypothetical protein